MIERIRRFPRTADKDLLFMAKIRAKYPAPDYNPREDGSYNPADMVIDFHLNCSKKKMRRLCRKHSLEDTGTKRKLMKRMYLHWRASKLWQGTTYYGYGKGFENTRIPDCVCGYINVKEWQKTEQLKENVKILNRKFKQNFGRTEPRRFPRLAEGDHLRFPRLK